MTSTKKLFAQYTFYAGLFMSVFGWSIQGIGMVLTALNMLSYDFIMQSAALAWIMIPGMVLLSFGWAYSGMRWAEKQRLLDQWTENLRSMPSERSELLRSGES